MKVECSVVEDTIENEDEVPVPGVVASCGRCENSQEAYGTGIPSVRRALVKLRETCPLKEENHYTSEHDPPPKPKPRKTPTRKKKETASAEIGGHPIIARRHDDAKVSILWTGPTSDVNEAWLRILGPSTGECVAIIQIASPTGWFAQRWFATNEPDKFHVHISGLGSDSIGVGSWTASSA